MALSDEQCEVLRGVLAREAGEVRFTPAAERLLFDRLGFAPRLLAQEGRKLAAASAAETVDEDLVCAPSAFPGSGQWMWSWMHCSNAPRRRCSTSSPLQRVAFRFAIVTGGP